MDARRAAPGEAGQTGATALGALRDQACPLGVSLLCSILVLRYALGHRGLPRLVGLTQGPSPGVAGEGPAVDRPSLSPQRFQAKRHPGLPGTTRPVN